LYAQLFPRRVRALVLDGAVDPGTASLQDDITQAEGFQVALRSFAAWCLAAASCPLRGGAGSGVGSGAGSGVGSGAPGSGGAAGSVNAAMAKLQGLVARANSVPLANQLGDSQLADGAMLLNGVAAALYSKSYWTDLETGLTDAFAGNGTVLVQLANLLVDRNPNGTYANLVDADTSISCLDRPWPRSLASWRGGGAGYGPRARGRSWSWEPCATPPRRTGGRRRWRAICLPACCSAGTATATPPTARAAPAWTRS
jgi:pimeloyl-ACP methyl ester carboxylesterase